MHPIFQAHVKQGKLVIPELKDFTAYLQRLEGKTVELIVRLWRKDRSIQQNRYMWGCVYQLISETTGYSPDEVHDAMRMLFLKDISRKIPTLRSTTELSTIEFEEYLEKIRMFAAQELNCVIPEPNQVDV